MPSDSQWNPRHGGFIKDPTGEGGPGEKGSISPRRIGIIHTHTRIPFFISLNLYFSCLCTHWLLSSCNNLLVRPLPYSVIVSHFIHSLLNFLFLLYLFTSLPAVSVYSSIPQHLSLLFYLAFLLFIILMASALPFNPRTSHSPSLFALFPCLFYYSPLVFFISFPASPPVHGVAIKVRLAPWISCRFMMLPSPRNHRDQGQTKTTPQWTAIDRQSPVQQTQGLLMKLRTAALEVDGVVKLASSAHACACKRTKRNA